MNLSEIEKAVAEKDYDKLIDIVKSNLKSDVIIDSVYENPIRFENSIRTEKNTDIIHDAVIKGVVDNAGYWFPELPTPEKLFEIIQNKYDVSRQYMNVRHIILTILYLSGINKRKAGYLMGKNSGHTSTIYAMKKIKHYSYSEVNTCCAFVDCFFSVKKSLNNLVIDEPEY